jgi:hypothetical protein
MHHPAFNLKLGFSEARFCLLLQVDPTRLGLIEGASFCVRLQVEPSGLGPIDRASL